MYYLIGILESIKQALQLDGQLVLSLELQLLLKMIPGVEIVGSELSDDVSEAVLQPRLDYFLDHSLEDLGRAEHLSHMIETAQSNWFLSQAFETVYFNPRLETLLSVFIIK